MNFVNKLRIFNHFLLRLSSKHVTWSLSRVAWSDVIFAISLIFVRLKFEHVF